MSGISCYHSSRWPQTAPPHRGSPTHSLATTPSLGRPGPATNSRSTSAVLTSRPESGSSRISRSGLCSRAADSRTFWRMPFESSAQPDRTHRVWRSVAAGFVVCAACRRTGSGLLSGAFGGAWNPKADPDEFQNFREAPLAKIAMNFRLVERDAAHCTVITETRVYAGGAPVVRRVAAYWRVIYPGSALMRHIWLRAIKLRAEGAKETRAG